MAARKHKNSKAISAEEEGSTTASPENSGPILERKESAAPPDGDDEILS